MINNWIMVYWMHFFLFTLFQYQLRIIWINANISNPGFSDELTNAKNLKVHSIHLVSLKVITSLLSIKLSSHLIIFILYKLLFISNYYMKVSSCIIWFLGKFKWFLTYTHTSINTFILMIKHAFKQLII